MKKLTLFLLVVIVVGCKKNEPEAIYDINIYIHYKDSLGNELFSNGANNYLVSNTRLYFIKNNNKEMVNTARPGFIPDEPYGYAIDSSTGKKIFIIGTAWNIINDTSTTFIDLKSGVEDTLKCSFFQPNSNPNSVAVSKVWYNGKLMGRSFDIVK